jgi:hypothetical protein
MKIQDIITENQQCIAENRSSDDRSQEKIQQEIDQLRQRIREVGEQIAPGSNHPQAIEARRRAVKPLVRKKRELEARLAVMGEDVAEGRLNEFAPGGSEGNGPFEYGTAIIQIGEDFVDTYSDEGAGADARAIIKVGNTFMSAGMEAGIRAFYAMDTQVRDHVAEQLMDQGFNVRQDIYEPYDQQFTAAEAANGIKTILALLKEFLEEYKWTRSERKIVEGIYKAFQQGMEPGFVALRNAFEFDIDADFYDFARDRGIDLDQVAARAGFDTDSLH